MRTPRIPLRVLGVFAALVFAMAACGDSSDDSPETASDDGVETPDLDDGSDGTSDADEAEDSDSASAATATASVGGASYEFPDVVECEVDGETWGEGWRKLVAWSADGHDLLDITVGNAESESLGVRSSISIVIGTQNPNTLDEANPDEEWSDLFGDEAGVTASLTSSGASGTASVGQASGENGTAEWSFAC